MGYELTAKVRKVMRDCIRRKDLDDPLEDLVAGMIKIKPQEPGSGTQHRAVA